MEWFIELDTNENWVFTPEDYGIELYTYEVIRDAMDDNDDGNI
jgi:hypothetical protein